MFCDIDKQDQIFKLICISNNNCNHKMILKKRANSEAVALTTFDNREILYDRAVIING